MSFYPLLNDEQQLRELDGWLVSTIHRSVQLRSKLLLSHGYNKKNSFPFSVARDDILEAYRYQRVGSKMEHLLEIPSFTLIHRALQRGLRESGIEQVMHPSSNKYAYNDN